MKSIVDKINQSPKMAVIAATGGGASWVGDFLNYGGGSATLVEFFVPYAQKSFEEYVGGRVLGKFVSNKAARQLALTSYERCVKHTGDSFNSIGIGLTCSLIKTMGEREGRLNHGCIAVQTWNNTKFLYFELNKEMVYDRDAQERWICRLIYSELYKASTGNTDFKLYLETFCNKFEAESADPHAKMVQVFQAPEPDYSYLCPQRMDDKEVKLENENTDVIYSGSFNPVHVGHTYMADTAKEKVGKPVFELSVVNYEKPKLDYYDIKTRVEDIWANGYDVVLTNVPLMVQKAALLKPKVCVMGIDTYSRIALRDLVNLHELSIKCLVFPRNGEKHEAEYEHSLAIHKATYSLKNEYNISSTQIRENEQN